MRANASTAPALALSALALLAACARDNSGPDPQLAANLAAPYDYYIANMQSSRFDSTGALQYKLSATRATHFPTDNHAELTDPVLLWIRADAAPWTITARQGDLHQRDNADELTLYDDVKADTTLSQSGILQVQTSSIDLLPALKLARTTAAVQVTTPTLHLQGSGLDLDLSGNTIDLRKDVKGHYEP